MILHTHHITEEGNDDLIEVYVVHASPVEAKFLVDALAAALENSPESESYAITLGRVADLEPAPTPEAVEEPESPLLQVRRNGLIVPGA